MKMILLSNYINGVSKNTYTQIKWAIDFHVQDSFISNQKIKAGFESAT